jgi:hypothetical protein
MNLEPHLDPELTWRTSSYSGGQGGECVEVGASRPGGIAIRDSKDRAGAALDFPREAWLVFVAGLKG